MFSSIASLSIPQACRRMTVNYLPSLDASRIDFLLSSLATASTPITVKFITEEYLTVLKASTLNTVIILLFS